MAFGLELGAVGIVLLVGSRAARHLGPLIATALAVELAGIAIDIYKVGRGHSLRDALVWIAIHTVVIATGLVALRRAATAR